ncbi:hypothetical protein J2S10_002241 [Neobacillus ginsengisoli]|uniref:DUF4044 domain-containing protein n=1 Tax=Neobacillus ginsengisoli TaxID=904295 RepID=A0ABT9XU51_9BACI|nr:hypothetical protein [Neobacillus ginsengisoli]
MTRKWKWMIACFLFLLVFNGLGILIVHLIGR